MYGTSLRDKHLKKIQMMEQGAEVPGQYGLLIIKKI
jgi:hypothetical protein